MNDGAALTNALQAALKGINAAGGNAHFLDMRGPPNDGTCVIEFIAFYAFEFCMYYNYSCPVTARR